MVEEQTYQKISMMLGIICLVLTALIFSLMLRGLQSHEQSLQMGYYFSKCEDLYKADNECEISLDEIQATREKYDLEDMEFSELSKRQPKAEGFNISLVFQE